MIRRKAEQLIAQDVNLEAYSMVHLANLLMQRHYIYEIVACRSIYSRTQHPLRVVHYILGLHRFGDTIAEEFIFDETTHVNDDDTVSFSFIDRNVDRTFRNIDDAVTHYNRTMEIVNNSSDIDGYLPIYTAAPALRFAIAKSDNLVAMNNIYTNAIKNLAIEMRNKDRENLARIRANQEAG